MTQVFYFDKEINQDATYSTFLAQYQMHKEMAAKLANSLQPALVSCPGCELYIGKREEDLKCYDKALELDPKNFHTWHNKGIALDELCRHEEALKCWDKILELEPKNTEALYCKGTTFGKLKKYEEAIKYYDKALEIDPKDADALFNN